VWLNGAPAGRIDLDTAVSLLVADGRITHIYATRTSSPGWTKRPRSATNGSDPGDLDRVVARRRGMARVVVGREHGGGDGYRLHFG
jgi:hypothetical protein